MCVIYLSITQRKADISDISAQGYPKICIALKQKEAEAKTRLVQAFFYTHKLLKLLAQT